jgi:hypothetical protein
MMTPRTSVAMTADVERTLADHLLRQDGQEDICLATYRPSTGSSRRTAVIREIVLPLSGDREVHGNASITGEYVLRAADIAQDDAAGVMICHSHPGGAGWQEMSAPDRDAESSFANLVREITGLPLVGMTLAGRDGAWSARHWDTGCGRAIAHTPCDSVRVVGGHLKISWNDTRVPPPPERRSQSRSIACWGSKVQSDLIRRRVLVVGAGSVGLDVALRLAATGMTTLGVMDFDTLEEGNLDRLIGASLVDVWLKRSKVEVARRLIEQNATADPFRQEVWDLSICEPTGLEHALDYDLIICCVDRPWPRAILNGLAYTDLIPVIDGGIAVDAFADGDGMRNATWRSHVLRPGRPCMSCNGQLRLGAVALEVQGLLDDPHYIEGMDSDVIGKGENVAILSISAAGMILAQFVSLNVAPGGMGDPGPLQYVLSTHTLESLPIASAPDCVFERSQCEGDQRRDLTGKHLQAEQRRSEREPSGLAVTARLARRFDRFCWRGQRWLTRLSEAQLARR